MNNATENKLLKERITHKQQELLVSFMENHDLFARSQIPKLGAQGKEKYKMIWDDLTEQLNQYDSTNKSVEGWQKTWKNLRLEAKVQKAKFIQDLHKTGNTAPTNTINDLYMRISNIFGRYGSGLSVVPESGVPRMQKENLYVKRTGGTIKQKQFLFSFLNNNKALANGDLDAASTKRMWSRLAGELNALDQDHTREASAWKKSWEELKSRSKNRLQDIQLKKPGPPLTASMKKALSIMGLTNLTTTLEPEKVYKASSRSSGGGGGLSLAEMGFLLDVPINAGQNRKYTDKKLNISPLKSEPIVFSDDDINLISDEEPAAPSLPSTSTRFTPVFSDDDDFEEPPSKKMKKGVSGTSDVLQNLINQNQENNEKYIKLIEKGLEEIRDAIVQGFSYLVETLKDVEKEKQQQPLPTKDTDIGGDILQSDNGNVLLKLSNDY